jgi:hypothetical protein
VRELIYFITYFSNNQWIKISEILRWNSEEDIISYNLNVEDNDNFFVGYTPVMAHNAEGGFVPSICSKPAPF